MLEEKWLFLLLCIKGVTRLHPEDEMHRGRADGFTITSFFRIPPTKIKLAGSVDDNNIAEYLKYYQFLVLLHIQYE